MTCRSIVQTTRPSIPAAAFLVLIAAELTCSAYATTDSHHGISISLKRTQNMSFDNGIYSSTANGAILNINDLENALAKGNVEVTTGNGSGGDDRGDLSVDQPFHWVGAGSLTLDAYHSITVIQTVSDEGAGALILTTNDGGTEGTLSFPKTGNIAVWGLTNTLTINGRTYTLVGDIQTLASDIAASPSGSYALANSYDAGKDGVYKAPPIATTLQGSFEGLGNTISNLGMSDRATGLFVRIAISGVVRDLRLTNVAVSVQHGDVVGGLAAQSDGLVAGDTVSGTLTSLSRESSAIGGLIGESTGGTENCVSSASVSGYGSVGGLVGSLENGSIMNSAATGAIDAKYSLNGSFRGFGGGLVGSATGADIGGSFATGTVTGGNLTDVGGLVGSHGSSQSLLLNSYATSAVIGEKATTIGGLIGAENGGTDDLVSDAYAAGPMTIGANDRVGGVVGEDGTDGSCGCFSDVYWDTTTTGISNPAKGAGNIKNDPGLTGLTTAQLQSGLPSGFDPTVWAENPSINNGLPYLIANPPPR